MWRNSCDKSQKQRMQVLEDFKMNTIQILICTDIVARGIDIFGLPCVVNMTCLICLRIHSGDR